MPRYFLGIDIGGTKSQALVADETGRVLGLGQGGPGNHETVGFAGLAACLQTITREALAAAGLAKDRLAGVGLGIGGYDWECEAQAHWEAIQTLELTAPTKFVNDTLIGLLAGAADGWGVAVVSGTACNCWGLSRERRVGRVTGHGLFMDEGAGASELVARAVQKVARAWTRRGPPTALTERLVQHVGAPGVADWLAGLTTGQYAVPAEAAPLVFQCAAEGDPVAVELVQWAGQALGDLAVGVIRQLNFEALEFEVVQVGSLFKGSPVLADTLRQAIHAVAPGARLTRLTVPPVVGGVLLGMEQAGLPVQVHRPALVAATRQFLEEKC